MKTKIILASIVILVGLGFGAISFVESTVEYTDFRSAMSAHRKVQVKGEWLPEKESMFDSSKGQFVFFMKDEKGVELKVVYDGAQPNNFELASAIVVKGRYEEGFFHASEILTKCPSKYEGTSQDVERTRQP
jgi:cytochrome c-type biogenesis protein CcmE